MQFEFDPTNYYTGAGGVDHPAEKLLLLLFAFAPTAHSIPNILKVNISLFKGYHSRTFSSFNDKRHPWY
jgi:hypothetical protein